MILETTHSTQETNKKAHGFTLHATLNRNTSIMDDMKIRCVMIVRSAAVQSKISRNNKCDRFTVNHHCGCIFDFEITAYLGGRAPQAMDVNILMLYYLLAFYLSYG